MRIKDLHWFKAAVLAAALCGLSFGAAQKPMRADLALEAAAKKETVDGDLKGAIDLYQQIIAQYSGTDRSAVAKALVRMGQCYEKLGSAQARKAYERAVREFSDQKEVAAAAQARLAALGGPRSGVTMRMLWNGPKVDLRGTVSPDGRYLSYVDWDTGDLAVHDFAARADRHVTNKGTWAQSGECAENSAISRDGKQVAYVWYNTKGYELRIASLQESGFPQQRRLYDNGRVIWVVPYDWSPDGKWIGVFLEFDDLTQQIGIVSTQDGSLRVLKAGKGLVGQSPALRFAPGGKYVAFSFRTADKPSIDVFVTATDGSREARVEEGPAEDVMMGWSPDGKYLLFASDRRGTSDLWAVPMMDGRPQGAAKLIRADVDPTALGVTAVGGLYIGKTISDRDIHIASVDFDTGRLLSPPERPVQTFVGSNSQPDWSPDGKFLAYVRAHQPARPDPVLAIRSLETGQTRELRPPLRNFAFPRWAPDGRSFVVQGSDSSQQQGIYRIDALTAEVEPIAVSARGSHWRGVPQCSADGKKIYYASIPQPEERSPVTLVERDLASGVERALAQMGEQDFSAILSPDGQYFAVERRDPGKFTAVVLIPSSGGDSRELARVNYPQTMRLAAWTRDSRNVMVARTSAAADPRELWLLPLIGGQHRKVEIDARTIQWPIRVHPNGRQIAYVAGESKAEVWVLENFLSAK